MVELKSQSKVLKLLDLNLKIDANFFTRISFNDKTLEELYEINNIRKENFLQGDLIFIIGWFCIFMYVYICFNRTLFIELCFSLLGLILFLIFLKRVIHDKNKKMAINNSIILIMSLFMNFKIYYLVMNENSKNAIYENEISRTLIYDFCSTNLLTLLSCDENVMLKIILAFMNFTSAITCSNNSNFPNCYYVDAITGICYSLIFHIFKKIWEYNLRSIYAERYCLIKLLNYSNDFINELNGIHFNRTSNNTLITGKLNREICKIFIKESIIDESQEIIDMIIISNTNDDYKNFMCSLKERNSVNNYSLHEKLENLQIIEPAISTNKFTNLGIYYMSIQLKSAVYYEVFHRKFHITESSKIDDIFFYDVTNFVNSQEKAIEDSLMRQKLYSKISHEFKTPVMNIIGILDDINFSLLEKGLKNDLHTIKNLSSYLILLSNDIINYSSLMNSEEIKINTDKIIMKKIVKTSLNILDGMLHCNLKSNKIETSVIFDEDICRINLYSDEIKINQILINFITNAVKHTKSGKIEILAEHDYVNCNIIISVQDTGIGMTDIDLNNLLDKLKFENKDCLIKEHLGLVLCKRLADLLNIKISISSQIGKGSKFSIVMPYSEKFNKILPFEIGRDVIQKMPIAQYEEYSKTIQRNEENQKTIAKIEEFSKSIQRNGENQKIISEIEDRRKSIQQNEENQKIIAKIEEFSKSIQRNKENKKIIEQVNNKTFEQNKENQKNIGKDEHYMKISEVDEENQNTIGRNEEYSKTIIQDDEFSKNILQEEVSNTLSRDLICKPKYKFSLKNIKECSNDSDFDSSQSEMSNSSSSKQINDNVEKNYSSNHLKYDRVEEDVNKTNNLSKNNTNDETEKTKSKETNEMISKSNSNNVNSNSSKETNKKISKSNSNNVNSNSNSESNNNVNSNSNIDSNKIISGSNESSNKLNSNNENEISENEMSNTNKSNSSVTIKINNSQRKFDFILDDYENFQKKKNIIIVVDDNHFINNSIKKIIESILLKSINNDYYEVICGSDGIDILKFIQEDQTNGNMIKLIITDENMEYMNGSEAIEFIRKMEKSGSIKHVNIISCTCHSDELTLKKILDAGSQLIIPKPADKATLEEAMRNLNII